MKYNNATPLELLIEKAEGYSKTTMELFKLTAIDKTAEVVSSATARLIILSVVALFIIIVNIGLGLWIGELLGKIYYGFFVVAGFYLFIAILLQSFKNQLLKDPISNSIVTQLLKEK